jgi:hypothetical protein
MPRTGRLAAGLAMLAVAGLACGKSQTPGAPASPASTSGPVEAAALLVADDDAARPADPRLASLWSAAPDGDPEELMRLADRVGCDGLHEGAARATDRLTALRAAQFCDDFSELPWLAEVATTGSDPDAHAALDAVVALAARPRRPVDPEDADELHAGCASLLALAKAVDRPRDRRVPAVSALRMLVDYGCVKKADIPADVDAR